MAQTPSATPTPIPALAPDDRVPCFSEGEVATLGIGPAMDVLLGVGPVIDVLLDVSIDELALVVDASVTLEGDSSPVNIAMIGSAASSPVYTKIVSVTSETYKILRSKAEVTVDPAVVTAVSPYDIVGVVIS